LERTITWRIGDSLQLPLPHLHIGAYPLPLEKIHALAARVSKILVIEEGMPFIERILRGVLPHGTQISGKLDHALPPSGELEPDLVRRALGLQPQEGVTLPTSLLLPPRPPQLCQGCPHGDTYAAIKSILQELPEAVITSDIGCYALGAVPPLSVPETIVCMGASVSMAVGAAEGGKKHAVAVIGDSTFLHSGVTPLIDAVARNVPITVVILDNGTVAMTGGQETILPTANLPALVRGLGVDPEHVITIEAHRKYEKENREILRREIEYPGVSVVIAVRECLETARKKKSGRRVGNEVRHTTLRSGRPGSAFHRGNNRPGSGEGGARGKAIGGSWDGPEGGAVQAHLRISAQPPSIPTSFPKGLLR
jgi:indolepyruvate ferredoxin oxidoreductase alpha subunit